MSAGTAGLLARQLKEIQTAKNLPGISCGLINNNVFEWEVMLMINDDCKYYGGRSSSSYLCSLPNTSPVHICIQSPAHTDNFPFRRQFSLPPLLPAHLPSPPSIVDIQNTHPFPPKHLPIGPPLHIHSTSTRRRPIRLRICV